MKQVLRGALLLGLFATASPKVSWAQGQLTAESKEAAYTRTINERAAKIVANLGPLDAKKAAQVQETIAGQYRQLNDVHERQKQQLSALKAQPKTEATAAAIKKVEAAATTDLDKLHQKYLARLSKNLTPNQVVQVKDGMTYGVLPITVKAYNDMLPDLTQEQKSQILTWLTEAREHAMDAGSSEQKHAWFGKYKGKINNYLSAAGIDMKQAGKDWQARREREATNAHN